MEICNHCGGVIDFIFKNGRRVPLHRDGNRCRGTNSVSNFENDFCRSTICPDCGAKVFFIRFNGGSVWMDDLGWPWPEHKCFGLGLPRHLNSFGGKRLHTLGIVLSIGVAARNLENRMIVIFGNKIKVGYFVKWPAPVKTKVGDLIVVSSQTRRVIYPRELGEKVLRSYIIAEEQLSKHRTPTHARSEKIVEPIVAEKTLYECEFCDETFTSATQMGTHLREHSDWCCSSCGFVTLSHTTFCSHLIDCQGRSS